MGHIPTSPPRSLWYLLPALILAACSACAHIPQQSASVKQTGTEASNLELRTRTVALGRDFLREIEIAGDSIEAGTKDPRIQTNSLQWKVSSVPAVEEAVLREDVVIAMLDLTAFREQTTAFLNSPAGVETFGDELPIAQRALVRIESEWTEVANALGVHITGQPRERFDAWVREHPIERVPFTRSTLVGETAHMLREQDTSIGAAVGGMQESLDRLEFRISLTNEFAVKQATWLSQLGALQVGTSPQANDLAGTLASSRSMMEQMPDLIADERVATLAEMGRQRRETIDTLLVERATVLADLANERAIMLAAVDEERRLAMRDVDSLRIRIVADEIHVVDHVIDHLMLRLAELLGGLVVLIGVFLLLLRRRAAA